MTRQACIVPMNPVAVELAPGRSWTLNPEPNEASDTPPPPWSEPKGCIRIISRLLHPLIERELC